MRVGTIAVLLGLTLAHGHAEDLSKWTHKEGKGVYELQVNKEGKVDRVRIMKSSGDPTFDREAVKTLGKWRLRRGPLVIELPLRFELTPINYSVDVGR